MAHHRKLVAGALAVNTVIVLVEAGAGFWAGSLGLVMDALHNLGDAGVSLAPAAAGVLILVFDRPFIDPLVAPSGGPVDPRRHAARAGALARRAALAGTHRVRAGRAPPQLTGLPAHHRPTNATLLR